MQHTPLEINSGTGALVSLRAVISRGGGQKIKFNVRNYTNLGGVISIVQIRVFFIKKMRSGNRLQKHIRRDRKLGCLAPQLLASSDFFGASKPQNAC